MSIVARASGQVVPSDLDGFFRTEILRRSWVILSVFGLVAFAAALLVAGSALFNRAVFLSILRNVWYAFLPFVATVIALLLIARRSARVQIATSPELSGLMTYEFDDMGMLAESEHGSGRLSWDALHAVRETANAFVLYRSNASYNFIPKRFIQPQDDVPSLRELIRSKLGAKAKLLKV